MGQLEMAASWVNGQETEANSYTFKSDLDDDFDCIRVSRNAYIELTY